MKRALSFAIIAISLVLLASCASTQPLGLIPAQDKDAQTYIQGSSMFSAKNSKNLQMIVGPDNYDGSNVSFIVSIASTNDKTFLFRDDDLALYGGNRDRNNWKLIRTWDSTAYFKDMRRQAHVAIAATGIVGAIAIIDAILNPDDAPDLFLEIAADAMLIHSDLMDLEASMYVQTDASIVTAISAIEAGIAINQLSSMYDAEMRNLVLQVPAKADVSSVSGKVIFQNIPKYPDYKLVFRNGKSDMEFIFSRTDRDEVIHPWKDKSSSIFALNYTYTYGLDRHHITMNFLEPQYVGGFAGVGLRPAADSLYVGLSAGLNFKIADYSWLSAGVEIGDLASDKDEADLLGSVGFNICANMISLYGGAVYDNGKFYGELGAGIAF